MRPPLTWTRDTLPADFTRKTGATGAYLGTLTAMGSAVSLAQRTSSPERTAFAIDVLADQVDHLRQLTLELLELSRVDAGRDDEQRELTDVKAIAARLAVAQGLDADVVVQSMIPTLHEVNSLRFERTIGNLLENATRYGGSATRVECRHLGGVLRVTVDDCGPGVPPGERMSIFGRFHRGSASWR